LQSNEREKKKKEKEKQRWKIDFVELRGVGSFNAQGGCVRSMKRWKYIWSGGQFGH